MAHSTKHKKYSNAYKKNWKEKVKISIDAISDLVKHGFELEKIDKKYGNVKKRQYVRKRPQGGLKD